MARVRALMRIARLQYELDESNRKLYQLSITDYLTGLSNMRHFYSEAEKMFLRAGKKNGSMSVIMFDLDRFKNVVDTNGHPFGSKVLADIGGLMRSLIHGPDNILSRYGGDEFMIALEDAGEKKAEEVSGLLQRKLNSAVFEFEGKKVRGISASFGVAVYKNGEHRDLQDMIRDADAAMFEAKENGRGLIRVRV